jgi:adhesin transport system membrane fusion protein
MLPITDQKITESQRQLYDLRVRSFSQEIKGRERLLNLVAAELAANKPLLESGDVGLAEVMRLERAVAQAEVELVAIKNKYYQSLQEQYVEVDAELASEREVLKQREVSLSAMTVKAPVSGVVKQIGFSTLGAVVKATDTLVEIVPEGDVLVVEARISPRDIAFVTIGQPASMSFDTYDASIYGSAAGQVIFVSPDSVILERSGQSEVFFPARVQVSTETMFERGDVDLSIRAGMTGSVEVKTGRNTVLHYLFKPLVKTFSESLGER